MTTATTTAIPFTLRPGVPADKAFVYSLMVAAMKEYATAAYGWDEAQERRWFDAYFPPANKWRIVVVDGQAAGAFAVVRQNTPEWYVENLYLLPAFQGHGIGGAILRGILADARRAGAQGVSLHVLKVNRRARALYERVGFRAAEETDIKYHMVLPLA